MTQRVMFPGFTLVRVGDNATHEVEIGSVICDGRIYTIDMIRSKKSPNGSFLPASVQHDGQTIWKFSKGTGLAFLALPSFPTIVRVDGKAVIGVTPLIDLPVKKIGSLEVSSRDLSELIYVKVLAAAELGLKSRYTENELKVLNMYWKQIDKLDQEREAVRKETLEAKHRQEIHERVVADQRRQAEEIAERQRRFIEARDAEEIRFEEAEKAKRKRIQAIKSRPVVHCETTGGHRKGIPVTDDEWKSLNDGVWVILEDNGKPLESFVVSKTEGGKVSKKFLAEVIDDNDQRPLLRRSTPMVTVPEPEKEVLLSYKGQFITAVVYDGVTDMKTARAAGLNGGTLIGVPCQGQPGRYTVYRVHSDGVDTLGNLEEL